MTNPEPTDLPARLVTGLAAHRPAAEATLAAARELNGPEGFERGFVRRWLAELIAATQPF